MTGCVNRPTDGATIEHVGTWPNVVVENNTAFAYFPVAEAFRRWRIGNVVYGDCASFPDRVCYRFDEQRTKFSGGYTVWTMHGGTHTVFQCHTMVNPGARLATPEKRQELLEHEIGHCYGMAHVKQGSGVMSPTSDGQFTYPTQDEIDTMRSLYR
jgi:hypothetical protein